ncbi:GNAT family N-acetyltransferase [Carnobacterium viridans]|uniref:Ribosomal-protein-alanine N-acetyltransferase n=1 Tax=Carnobacterium viridans TaxID=174587 RepID=A0A1H0Z9Z8_9LACT|nr:GNAT family N-acetyltransferase [Carnobacterium viridans]UDE94737.1 GNAT family N-acetyltransferase [Carnobacterium viridans]SDQ24210.1 ribosomal-protein-alanine N-acetyltransferase [Carnobacterium viridans]
MNFKIDKLSQQNAMKIADDWKYDGEYSFYDMTEDPEDYEEIISPLLRENNYFQVIKNEEFFGFFVLEQTVDTVDMGVGIKPELTGNRLGVQFISLILNYIKENYSVTTVRLGVAKFNIRAQIVYEKVGFTKTREYQQPTNGTTYTFVEMEFIF